MMRLTEFINTFESRGRGATRRLEPCESALPRSNIGPECMPDAMQLPAMHGETRLGGRSREAIIERNEAGMSRQANVDHVVECLLFDCGLIVVWLLMMLW